VLIDGRSIADVLDMSVDDCLALFSSYVGRVRFISRR
jgi:excinuclease UvrABC ATPase subunit